MLSVIARSRQGLHGETGDQAYEDNLGIPGERIAFSLPGEPTDGFLSQIAMFDLTLRRGPPPLNKARVIAHLGAGKTREIPERWRPYLKNVEIRFVEPDPKYPHAYFAQADDRLLIDEPDIDYVIMSDADTLVLGHLDELLQQLKMGVPLAGVVAHFPPIDLKDPNDAWRKLAIEFTGKPIRLRYPYTLSGVPVTDTGEPVVAPFYINYGFVAFRADALREFSKPCLKMQYELVGRLKEQPQFVGQISMTLTQHALGWQSLALPLRYNFPNDARALELHKYECFDIRVLHYLREVSFRRSELFASPDAFNRFIGSTPQGADALVRAALMSITKGHYPF